MRIGAVAKYFKLYLKIEPSLLFCKQTRFRCSTLSPVTKIFVTSGVCSSDKNTPIYFLRLSKVWSISHHGSVGRGHKKCNLILFLFFIIKFVFLSFSFLSFFFLFFLFFFLDEVSNFRNRILTNQKRELVVSNCQLNCIPSCFPKEHKISIFKAMTSDKLTRGTDKSIYSFLLLNQLSRPSVMLRHILNYQHMHVRLFRTHKVF